MQFTISKSLTQSYVIRIVIVLVIYLLVSAPTCRPLTCLNPEPIHIADESLREITENSELIIHTKVLNDWFSCNKRTCYENTEMNILQIIKYDGSTKFDKRFLIKQIGFYNRNCGEQTHDNLHFYEFTSEKEYILFLDTDRYKLFYDTIFFQNGITVQHYKHDWKNNSIFQVIHEGDTSIVSNGKQINALVKEDYILEPVPDKPTFANLDAFIESVRSIIDRASNANNDDDAI